MTIKAETTLVMLGPSFTRWSDFLLLVVWLLSSLSWVRKRTVLRLTGPRSTTFCVIYRQTILYVYNDRLTNSFLLNRSAYALSWGWVLPSLVPVASKDACGDCCGYCFWFHRTLLSFIEYRDTLETYFLSWLSISTSEMISFMDPGHGLFLADPRFCLKGCTGSYDALEFVALYSG